MFACLVLYGNIRNLPLQTKKKGGGGGGGGGGVPTALHSTLGFHFREDVGRQVRKASANVARYFFQSAPPLCPFVVLSIGKYIYGMSRGMYSIHLESLKRKVLVSYFCARPLPENLYHG